MPLVTNFLRLLRDSSKSVLMGSIKVQKEAKGTNAYQANRNLILSNNAKAYSMPILEIEANDVKCTHGSATGGIDGELMFYLASRGIKKEEAQKIIIEGYFEEVIDKIN